MIDVFDKMPDAVSRLGDVFILIDVDFFFLEGADESFGISVLPRTPPTGDRNLNAMLSERREIGISKILHALIGMVNLRDAVA